MDDHQKDISHHSDQIPRLTKRADLMRQIKEADERIMRIDKDFSDGFDTISKYTDTVTVFGSARSEEDSPYYKKARELGGMLASEGYTVITGGGGGIMEAANRGAHENGGRSIGFNIQLPMEQEPNPYTTDSLNFRYFFSRKVMLAFASQALICFPGGYGTMDEFFEILTLVQTKKMPKVPIILVGKEFWRPLDVLIQDHMLDSLHLISPGDENLYTITDDMEVIRQILDEHERVQISEILSNNEEDI